MNEFGLVENESMNLTCDVTANPEPSSYKWMLVNSAVNVSTMTNNTPCYIVETDDEVLKYTRPNDTNYGEFWVSASILYINEYIHTITAYILCDVTRDCRE